MSSRIELIDILDSVELKLGLGKTVVFLPSGNSMRPVINGLTDKVEIKKPNKLKKNNIYLYLRASDNHLVLHRLIKVNPLVFKGDGNVEKETGDFKIIGEISKIYKKHFVIKPKRFLFYFYTFLSYLKYFYFKLYNFGSKIFNKFKKIIKAQ